MSKYDCMVFNIYNMTIDDLQYISNIKKFNFDLLNYLMVDDLILVLTGNSRVCPSKLNKKNLPNFRSENFLMEVNLLVG